MPAAINPHELQALAAVLAAEAGEDAGSILGMDPDELAALLSEGGADDDSADTFPGAGGGVL